MIKVPSQVTPPSDTTTASSSTSAETSLHLASDTKVNNPYATYPDAPYVGAEAKSESDVVNPSAFASEQQSLPSIASLLSEGQTQGENPASNPQSAQSTPLIPTPPAPSEMHGRISPVEEQGGTPHGTPHGILHGSSHVGSPGLSALHAHSPSHSEQSAQSTPHVQPRASSVSPRGVNPLAQSHMHTIHTPQGQVPAQAPVPQGPVPIPQVPVPMPVHVPAVPPMPASQVQAPPPHMHLPPGPAQGSPRPGASHPASSLEYGQVPMQTRSPAPYMMNAPPHQAPPPAQAAGWIPQQPMPGHPYMMQNQQYWPKAPMHPMYPVGMQQMAPVMQYYPTASGPYRTGHRSLSMGQEIKRRTKTGCLTCRRRRIKCDEQHPMCKNCSKSERICLGYDPILMSFSTDKSARLKQLQLKRRRFAQGQKYDKMRVASLVESIPPDAPHSWSHVVELYRYIAPRLDELFDTRQFSAIGQHVAQQLKHQGEAKIVGELEVVLQLVTIVFSDRNFDSLNVLDFPGANLEKLRATNDYLLLRSVIEGLTLADASLHTTHIADDEVHSKVMLMKQVIFSKGVQTTSPVSAAEIAHAVVHATTSPQQSWLTISDLLTRGGQEIQVPPQVGPLGTLVIASVGELTAQQLLQQDLDPLSRTLLELSLDPL